MVQKPLQLFQQAGAIRYEALLIMLPGCGQALVFGRSTHSHARLGCSWHLSTQLPRWLLQRQGLCMHGCQDVCCRDMGSLCLQLPLLLQPASLQVSALQHGLPAYLPALHASPSFGTSRKQLPAARPKTEQGGESLRYTEGLVGSMYPERKRAVVVFWLIMGKSCWEHGDLGGFKGIQHPG